MAPATGKNDFDEQAAGGGRQAELEAQLAQLRAEILILQANNQAPRPPPTESKPRVPSGLPRFKGKRDEDVRQWVFQVETLCLINDHDATNDNDTLPAIAGTAMEEPASGWFLFWASRTTAEEQTWGRFSHDALAHFEASNYQAVLRQKLRQLRQVGDIEEYNGEYSSLIFRVENMSEVDQVSYYCDGLKWATQAGYSSGLLKRATQAYVKLQNATTLSEAMDQAAKYEMSHFGGERKSGRERPEREQRFRGPQRSNSYQDKKPFSKRSYKPGHYAPVQQTKEGPVCYHCKKPGLFKRDCNKLKTEQGNEKPRQ